MSKWRVAVRKGAIEVRPFVDGEENEVGYRRRVAVSPTDWKRESLAGGWIARNPQNHDDVWYIAPEYFQENYAVTTLLLAEGKSGE